MFCPKCGAEIEKGGLFCSNCGAAIGKGQFETGDRVCDKEIRKIKLPKKIPVKLLAVTGGAIIAVVIIVAAVSNTTPTIDLDDYLIFEAEGYDGYGKLNVKIDWDSIDEKYGKKLAFTVAGKKELARGENSSDTITPIDVMYDMVDINLDSNTSLHNGDIVNYTWNVSPSLSDVIKADIRYQDDAYTVVGLEEIERFDPFADLEVQFEGLSPNGTVLLSYGGGDLSEDDFRYNRVVKGTSVEEAIAEAVIEGTGLRNGDVINVFLSNQDVNHYAETIGKIPETFSKEYEVSGLDGYVESYSDLDGGFLDALKQDAQETILAGKVRASWVHPFDNLEYAGYIFQNQKIKEANETNGYNNLYIIYTGDIHISDFYSDEIHTIKVYCPVLYTDILKTKEGCSYGSNEGVVGQTNLYEEHTYTAGYTDPIICYQELVEDHVNKYDSECGDGFEVFANAEPAAELSL